MGRAGARRPPALRVPDARRRPGRAQLGNDPPQAAVLPAGLRRVRPGGGRALHGEARGEAAGRSRDRPQPAQGGVDDLEREGRAGGAGRVRQPRRLPLAVRRRRAAPQPLAVDARGAGPDGGVGRDEQGAPAPRLPLRRLDDLLRVHAGRRHGQRPHDTRASDIRHSIRSRPREPRRPARPHRLAAADAPDLRPRRRRARRRAGGASSACATSCSSAIAGIVRAGYADTRPGAARAARRPRDALHRLLREPGRRPGARPARRVAKAARHRRHRRARRRQLARLRQGRQLPPRRRRRDRRLPRLRQASAARCCR